MGLKQRLHQDLKDALRAGDDRRKRVIRMALTAITNAEVEKGRQSGDTELGEDELVAVLFKQAKQRRETIDELAETDRSELLAEEKKELAVLEAYLPEQLSAEQVAAEAREVIDAIGATGMQDVGPVIGRLMSRLKGRADGHMVNRIVRELLSSR